MVRGSNWNQVHFANIVGIDSNSLGSERVDNGVGGNVVVVGRVVVEA